MSDLLLILGLAFIAAAGFVASLGLGLVLTGAALIILSLALADGHGLPLPKVRPWRRS